MPHTNYSSTTIESILISLFETRPVEQVQAAAVEIFDPPLCRYVQPMALRALAEIGIDHDGRSKQADEFRDVPFDLVVTVCDDAAENCPVWLGQGKRVHLGFPDPAKATGMNVRLSHARRNRFWTHF